MDESARLQETIDLIVESRLQSERDSGFRWGFATGVGCCLGYVVGIVIGRTMW